MNGNNLGGILSNNTLAWKKLCEWSQMNTATVIFDSDIDSHEHVQFVHRILNKDNLYFIVEDDARNIFGCFISKPIVRCHLSQEDTNHFVFLLEDNKRNNLKLPTRWFPTQQTSRHSFYLFGPDDYLLFRFGYRGSVRIARPNTHNSYCYNLSEGYNGLNDLSLTGNNSPTQFDVTRIIVIQMQ